jgi:rhamnogalacturonyl hydrolase YesR
MALALAKSYEAVYKRIKLSGCIWEEDYKTGLWYHTFDKKKVKAKLENLAALIYYHSRSPLNLTYNWKPMETT